MPHFSFVITGLPVRSFRKGFGLTGTCGPMGVLAAQCGEEARASAGLLLTIDMATAEESAAATATRVLLLGVSTAHTCMGDADGDVNLPVPQFRT